MKPSKSRTAFEPDHARNQRPIAGRGLCNSRSQPTIASPHDTPSPCCSPDSPRKRAVLDIAGARPRPMEAINSHKQGPRAPQTVPRTCCACRCLDAGRSRRADLTRGRAGRHGAEFPPGRGCAMTDPVMRAWPICRESSNRPARNSRR